MRKFWKENKKIIIFVFQVFLIWHIFLLIPEIVGPLFLPQREGFIGEVPWGNFDGVHYISIAKNNYYQYEQAFFPLFPLLIKTIGIIIQNYTWSAIVIVNISLVIALFIFYKLILIDFKEKVAKWSIVFFLFFPTSFFLKSIYNESLFLALLLSAFYSARKQKWLLAGILGAFASLTRFVGVLILIGLLIEYFSIYKLQKNDLIGVFSNFFRKGAGILLVPLGLFAYMIYLFFTTKDPLAFIHVQPAFGANRSGGEIILLPQVIYRYFKILISVSPKYYDFWVSLIELLTLGGILSVLIKNIKKIRLSYLIFSLLAVLIPTLSGTLSSMPRYILVAFPLFIIFGKINNTMLKILLLILFAVLQLIFSIYFTRGYFIA